LIEARNNTDNTVYAGEKAIREYGDKIPAEVRSEVEARIAEAKSAAEREDVEIIRSATDALGLAIQKIGASAYEQGKASAGGEADSNPDVVDGEVKE
jgi:molecular chaperone DnaK